MDSSVSTGFSWMLHHREPLGVRNRKDFGNPLVFFFLKTHKLDRLIISLVVQINSISCHKYQPLLQSFQCSCRNSLVSMQLVVSLPCSSYLLVKRLRCSVEVIFVSCWGAGFWWGVWLIGWFGFCLMVVVMGDCFEWSRRELRLSWAVKCLGSNDCIIFLYYILNKREKLEGASGAEGSNIYLISTYSRDRADPFAVCSPWSQGE